ncbi:MAG TPA: hypothetical protein VEI50_02815 [Nitrospiraceae bacterium]|nr:hypothetical protein [Nitrospiraceae bacterium]
MNIMSLERTDRSASEQRLLEVLRENGPQTLESLCTLPDMSWAQVLMAVDHLSRSREVAIELIAPSEYQVSLSVANA